MKPLSEIIPAFQALSTIGEDQFEAALTAAIADLQAFASAQTTVRTATSVVINYSDGTIEQLPK